MDHLGGKIPGRTLPHEREKNENSKGHLMFGGGTGQQGEGNSKVWVDGQPLCMSIGSLNTNVTQREPEVFGNYPKRGG